MNADFILRALCFHGQPLQKIWEDERGTGDLQLWGVAPHNNYTIYAERQKHFTFQDRAKRLKLHQFFSRKAIDLYGKNLEIDANLSNDIERLAKLENVKPYIAAMPPFEIFVNKNQDKFKRLRCMLEALKPGDIIYGVVTKAYQTQVMVKPLCTAEPLVRYLGDVTIKAGVQKPQVKAPLDAKGNPRSYVANDFVCCEIIDVSVYTDRLNLSMENTFSKNKNVKLGLVSADELPEYYRSANNNALTKYNDCLFKAKEFLNPNYDVLYELLGLNVQDSFTLMHKLKHPFPKEEYATELRQAQASKWAFRSVAEGIEHFKIGRHVEAFQCLNKALNIDPRNVEGLVARGALYANKGSFVKAVDDFEKALKLNSFHVNARKYMGETLVALGRSYEDDNRIEDAIKAYRDCLNIIPNHEQARLSLEVLQQRPGSHLFDNLLNIPGTMDIDLNALHGKKNITNEEVSSTADSDSSESDTDSESSGDRIHAKKDRSLSPLSKRMAAQTSSSTSSMTNAKTNYNQPFFLATQNSMESSKSLKIVSNEFRLDDDDETESRVRKLLQDASKYKKQKSKKSKKKKSKKSKKESRKNKSASTVNTLGSLNEINYQDALKAFTSGLSAESKLNENLQIYEQAIAQVKKRKDLLEQSSNNNQIISRSDSPPPKAPSMRLSYEAPPPPPTMNKKASGNGATSSRYPNLSTSLAAAKASKEEAPRFSFTIKRPVKVDKFGLVRIATPLTSNSPVKSHSRSRSPSPRSRHRPSQPTAHSRSRERYSRSLSPSSRNRKRRHSRSRRSSSRNRRYRRSRTRSPRSRRVYGRPRTPSPFVPRGTPPPRRRISRGRARPSPARKPKNYGNLVWQRPGYKPPTTVENSINSDRWEHDKFLSGKDNKVDEGPSIEEIDEIINKAQKERKEEIIKRDKNILKKNV